MKNKKKIKKGFTLIELLAVIVILAVIALIVTPIVSNVISSSKASANARSVEGHVKSVEYAIARKDFDSASMNGVKTAEQLGIEFQSNDKVRCDSYIVKNGSILSASNCNEKDNGNNDVWTTDYYYYQGKGASTDSSIIEAASGRLPAGLTIGSPVYFNPKTNELCTESDITDVYGEEANDDCNKWYVYKNNGDGTYQLILCKNTDASSEWSDSDNTDSTKVTNQLANDIKNWHADVKATARLISADEIAEITGHTFDSSTATTGFNLDDDLSDGDNKYSWLFDYTQDCLDYKCKIDGLLYFGYWTSTKVSGSTTYVWAVNYQNDLMKRPAGESLGIRPVITL